ncbi:hypothetical protein HZA87_04545 [Candidatus Uhrbacteria bacterium]|nr:hypothetical protein [Candidatus Uhrbacteria bacterium]
MTFLTRILQLVIIAIPLLLMGWLATQWLVPSGVFSVGHVVGEPSPFIDELQPGTRVLPPKDGVQAVIGDPAFFFVHPHRDFERIVLDVWFQNDSVPIVELGALSAVNPESYTLLPLHNRLIDESTWDRLDEDGVVLLQREKTYGSLAEFFADPPSRDSVATYRTTFDVPYRLAGYHPTSATVAIDVSLRGRHEFKTYIKDETLHFTFNYMDMNRDDGADVVRATVFNEALQPVAEARADDDNDTSDDAVATGMKSLDLEAFGLPEGVYKVVVDTTRDIFFRRIETSQQKIVFSGSVFVGDEIGYHARAQGAVLYTPSNRLRLQTRHGEGVQTVTSGSTALAIMEPYEWYVLALTGEDLKQVEVPIGDVEIVTDGKIAFSPSQYFNPDPVTLTAFTDLDGSGVDYVLAQYQSPRKEGEWLVAQVAFDTKGIWTQDGTWKFIFSTPGIEELDANLLVHAINAWLYRDPI